ncbi:2-hydroxyacid dehydrogenase [Paracoccus pacificus]|uniref:2-hydroxyacid dehydrogenase n=1 Tax=Paracoccus pacificus TaxID=1463598 RepID=A0ABW4R9T9_9RHOB
MPRIVFLDPTTDDRMARMGGFLAPGWTLDNASSRDPDAQLAALEGADYAIVSDVPMTAAMMAVPGLKAVHKWGVGFDNIDLEAARRQGVRVFRTTGSNAITVAETALGMILALNRNIVRGHVAVEDGRWPKSELAVTSSTLSGKTVGIVGLGYIGKALAGLLRGFGCRVLYSKRTPLAETEERELGVSFAALPDLLQSADVVTLNCELNDSTRNMINRDTLALMKPEALLINVARGGVVVESDLAEAIRAHRLRGAGVDVFSVEPVQPDNPLLGLDRVIVTPHIAAVSADGFGASVQRMFGNFEAMEQGAPPPLAIDVLV